MRIGLIVAIAENRVIGRDGDLPWRLPDDLAQFKRRTLDHAVIMGRKTWESLPNGALPRRHNVVVTRAPDYRADGATIANDLAGAYALARASGVDIAYVIGGASLLQKALADADEIVLTRVHARVEGDVTLDLDLGAFVELEHEDHPRDARHAYPFSVIVYRRR